MKTDLAINVHFNTLSKVKLFQVSSVAEIDELILVCLSESVSLICR